MRRSIPRVTACHSSYDAVTAITRRHCHKQRTNRRRMAASQDLDGGARLDRTVMSIT
jgi:hypothetical protein